MKKICITLAVFFIIFLTASCSDLNLSNSKNVENSEYLRIHIRANSNGDDDQSVKYIVKERVVKALTKSLADCHSKQEAISIINSKKKTLEILIDGVLKENGFNYSSLVTVKNELFPTRVYEGLTLNSGYYDAVIVELGKAKGDNWWCVVYPPFCFTSGENVKYTSKILEIIEEFKERFAKE